MFLKGNGIQHKRCVPYHPAMNGFAERAVETFNAEMKKSSGPLQACLSYDFFVDIVLHFTL